MRTKHLQHLGWLWVIMKFKNDIYKLQQLKQLRCWVGGKVKSESLLSNKGSNYQTEKIIKETKVLSIERTKTATVT